jgi:hypothetical protein
MALQFDVTLQNAQMDAISTEVGSAGFLEIYTGAEPANCAAATTGTKLSKHTLGSPFAPASSAGVLSPTLPANVNALATGTAGYWRVFKANDTTCVMQGTVGTSGADLNLNTLALVSGGPVQINSWTITAGGA